MRGDLSTRYGGPDSNFNGVLFQQGRVFLDRDGNAQTAITSEWEDVAGRDVIGAGVLAVPGDAPDSLKVEDATLAGGEVTLTIDPGHAWADGMLIRLDETPPTTRHATYLQPPIQDPPFDETSIGAGTRDAVVLEAWRHEVNGFQLPETLIEPALGGVDTTERIATGFDCRLYRMGPDDTCETIGGLIGDDPSAKGKLRVTLQPTVVTAGDCPTVEGGGYTGFEHALFRIEIAATTAAPVMFKWSQFNGGLVGRGLFDVGKLTIAANLAAITTSELSDFYLETVEWDASLGRWTVTFGTKVTLVGDELHFVGAAVFGTVPAAGSTVFFRLWNDIRPISDFPIAANPTELLDGIRLEFDPAGSGKYVPEDYWTFQVRAGGIGNPNVLVDSQPPEGIVYHRVPVAVLEWDGSGHLTADDGTIEDCRRVFQPLTRLGNCCTYRVGDGLVSHGEFTSIQAAIDALPPDGGKVCVLPGTFIENVRIAGRRNVTVSGCGRRSLVEAAPGNSDPVFHVNDSRGIRLEHLAVLADDDGVGVLLDAAGIAGGGDDAALAELARRGRLQDIVLDDLFVRAVRRSAIECRYGRDIVIENCTIWMADRASTWPGIFFIARDGRIEDNTVVVVRENRPPTPGTPFTAGAGLGGIQLGGGCERVFVLENLIQGGVGNGVTLGSISVIDDNGDDTGDMIGWVVNIDDPCNPCRPGDNSLPPDDGGGTRYVSAGPLRDIVIEDNRILDMGLNGIGVIAFFELESVREVISVFGLRIVENDIRRCLKRELAHIRNKFQNAMGYGGISLADVSFLEIRANLIEDNGPDHLQPVCGIFVLHGEGVEIVQNRIFNNGAKTDQPADAARPGPRGGIYIARCSPPLADSGLNLERALYMAFMPEAGAPALRVHENRVIAPLGRALTASTLGDVSVHGNHLSSLGIEQREGAALVPLPTTVMILDLGVSSFVGKSVSYKSVSAGTQEVNLEAASIGHGMLESSTGAALPRLGGEGRILFADNQVALDVADEQRVLGLASIAILSLGDVAIDDNQCSVTLAAGLLLTDLAAFGVSLRVNDNRLAEGLMNALFSGVTLGLMNMTTDNQATHCLLIRGWTGLVVNKPNTILVSAISKGFCERYVRVLGSFGTRIRREG